MFFRTTLSRFFLLTAFVLCLGVPSAAHALSVAPAIINIDGEPKDEVKKTIRLTNDSSGSAKANIYTFVWDLDTVSGARSFPEQNKLPLSDSLAQWIEISRASTELLPGETKEIPVRILVNLRARTGDYHAMISFAPGASRTEALDRLARGQGVDVLVNADITETVNEVLQLNRFAANKSLLFGASAVLALEVENIGDQPLVPVGEIHVTDKRGREVAVLPVNESQDAISPNEVRTFTVPWDAGKMGRYKAFLELKYGSSRAMITDAAFVTLVPIRVAIAVLLLVLAFILWRQFRRNDEYEYEYEDDEYEDDDIDEGNVNDIPEHPDTSGTPPRVQ